jgi:hypothetical protein
MIGLIWSLLIIKLTDQKYLKQTNSQLNFWGSEVIIMYPINNRRKQLDMRKSKGKDARDIITVVLEE